MSKWAKPLFTRGRVDAAGAALNQYSDIEADIDDDLDVINNWRSCHGYPLQMTKMTLLNRSRKIDAKAIVAQRTKRLWSIAHKLGRNDGMQLSRMNDIGGCRVVLRNVLQVGLVVSKYEASSIKNPNKRSELIRKYDYIAHPKPDGYRGVHLISRFRTTSSHLKCYNGLRIEIQIRTRLQHSWATAVETVSTFSGQALKSNIGDDRWKRFFALMGSSIAGRERRPLVPDTPVDPKELANEIEVLVKELRIEHVLEGWGAAINYIATEIAGADFYLLQLDPIARSISVRGFPIEDFEKAQAEYIKAEKAISGKPSGTQAVLVSVDSIDALRAAYPNYYLDTQDFVKVVKSAISGF